MIMKKRQIKKRHVIFLIIIAGLAMYATSDILIDCMKWLYT